MYYVAYGSNMNLKQMAFRCPKSKIIGNGKLIGWNLVFNIHADIIKTNNYMDKTPVVLWDIHDDDWAMLDSYEGYPHYYIKQFVNVIMNNGKKVKAVVYVMADDRKGISPPYSGYFETVLTGYNENGIDVDTLYKALEYSVYNKTEYNQYNTKKGKG